MNYIVSVSSTSSSSRCVSFHAVKENGLQVCVCVCVCEREREREREREKRGIIFEQTS